MMNEQATEKQVNYMKALGIEVPNECSKADAKVLIEAKVGFKAGGNNNIPQKTLIPADDNRQRLIVRQSSLKAAVDTFMTISQNTDSSTTVDAIKDLAEQFEEWVFR
tara:strand:+ start:304 stop:624 length:321 start_codon:yes stop_codon:yes gene_type:complete